jgi:hypothetical protein
MAYVAADVYLASLALRQQMQGIWSKNLAIVTLAE